jgi:NTP pyrophosphatase (non-canonical NTP hydrolase)
LSEETGELARDIINAELNLSNRRTGESITRKEAIARIEDDLGDVLYHIIQMANSYGIDLAEAFEKATASIKKRYRIPYLMTGACGIKLYTPTNDVCAFSMQSHEHCFAIIM